jgi:hypothetical protein
LIWRRPVGREIEAFFERKYGRRRRIGSVEGVTPWR